MLRDIPKLIDNFKDWFRWLDPVEKKIDNIASNIADIDVKKIDAVNGVNGSAPGGIIDKEDVDNMRQYNVETEKQTSFFGEYNQQRKILNQQLKQQKANLEATRDATLKE